MIGEKVPGIGFGMVAGWFAAVGTLLSQFELSNQSVLVVPVQDVCALPARAKHSKVNQIVNFGCMGSSFALKKRFVGHLWGVTDFVFWL